MVRPTSWLPLVALGLLVGLTLWLNQLVQAPLARADGSTRHDPDLIVENFNARKLGEDGRVMYTLNARKMVHYPDDNSALLESVRLEAYEPRQPKMTITADNGRLEQGGDRVFIEGNVVVVREAGASTEAARLTTDKVLVLPDEGIARGSAAVLLETASGRAHANAFEVNNRTRVLKLERVRATYKPSR
ncbi:MAG TPA: LPS export ABC transporter periplasmic protein LptC [Usitatibacter sp.]|nr:LPS export ABC transporter periplasmic protein LptC [Usitatibacter sp.]